MSFVPRGVTLGFVNAIGALIFLAQLPQLGLGRDGAEMIPNLAGSAQSISWPWVWGLVTLGLLTSISCRASPASCPPLWWRSC